MKLLALEPARPVDPSAVAAAIEPVVASQELAATPQDPVFHAEGDVWTHTVMALEALVASSGYAALEPLGRAIVATAVALHDAGKPGTTRHDDGRVTSRGHSALGAQRARVALWRAGVPFGVREQICALIRHHQVPLYGITRPDAEALALRLSLVLRHDWLVAVADADARGRRCADPGDHQRIVDHCALWAEHCDELGVLDRPRGFASPHTRRVWFESSGRHPDVAAHDDTTCEVIVMSGLPASGKDTWLRTHAPGIPVIALDDLRAAHAVDPDDDPAPVIAIAREHARELLRAGRDFAWNATNLTAPLRTQLLELMRSYRARTHVVYVETTADAQLARNAARADPVPRKVIARMLDKWSVPDPTEAHRVTYVVPPGSPIAWPPA